MGPPSFHLIYTVTLFCKVLLAVLTDTMVAKIKCRFIWHGLCLLINQRIIYHFNLTIFYLLHNIITSLMHYVDLNIYTLILLVTYIIYIYWCCIFVYLVDTDECKISKPCEQSCTNMPGSYTCTCNNGYILEANGKTCIG